MLSTLDSKVKNDSTLTNLSRVGVLLAALFPASLGEAHAFGQEAPIPATSTLTIHNTIPTRVSGVMDLITRWAPDKNLYVEGDIGVSEENLNRLATWLKNEHPNWTVYLAQHSQNETYTDASGTRHTGESALQYCLGHELPNRTKFNTLVDGTTGEPNGAILYITFDTRRVGYFAESAYDNRNIGEKSWAQNLDSLAIQQLKQRQVVAAVMSPIKEIDGRLQNILTKEGLERESAKNLAAEELQEMENTSHRIKDLIIHFAEAHPTVVGPLFEKPLRSLNESMEDARASFTRGAYTNLKEVSPQMGSILTEVSHTISEYDSIPNKIDALRQELAAVKGTHNVEWLQTEIVQAEDLLAKSSQEHALGTPGFISTFVEAERSVEDIKSSIIWDGRKDLAWAYLLDLIAAATISIGAYAVYRQREQRNSKQTEAQSLLAERERALDEKILTLFSLDEMKRICIGNSAGLGSLRGESKKLAEEILSDIGQMFILGSSALEVMKKVKEVLAPNTAWKAFQGALSAGHFQEAIEMLKLRPIVFEEGTALNTSLRNKNGENWLKLYGELQDYAPFSITFDELLNQFNTKGKHVEKTLNSISKSGERIPKLTAESSELLSKITSWNRKEIGGFECSIATDITKSAEQIHTSLQEVVSSALFDPVGVERDASSLISKMKYLYSVCRALDEISLSENVQSIKEFYVGASTSDKERTWVNREVFGFFDCVKEMVTHTQVAQKVDGTSGEGSQSIIVEQVQSALSGIVDKIQKNQEGKEQLRKSAHSIENAINSLAAVCKEYAESKGTNTNESSPLNVSAIEERLIHLRSLSREISPLFEEGLINEAVATTAELNDGVSKVCSDVTKIQSQFEKALHARSYAHHKLSEKPDTKELDLMKKIKALSKKWGDEVLIIPKDLQSSFAGLKSMDELFTQITSTRAEILQVANNCCKAFENGDFEKASRFGDSLRKLSDTLEILLDAPQKYGKHIEAKNIEISHLLQNVKVASSLLESKLRSRTFNGTTVKRIKESISRYNERVESIASIRSPFIKASYIMECNEIYSAADAHLENEIKKIEEQERKAAEKKKAEERKRAQAARSRRSSRSSGGGSYGSSSSSSYDSSSYGSSSSSSSSSYSSGFSSSGFDGGGSSGFSSSGW